MKFLTLVTFIIFSLTCNGQKKIDINFQMENDSTVVQFLRLKGIDFTNNQVATLRGIGTFGEYGRSKKLTVPDAYFFNSQGQMIDNSGKGEKCSAAIKNLEKLAKLKLDSNKTLASFLNDISVLGDNEFIADNIDLYIIINWAKFAPTESDTSLNWFSSLEKQENLRIKILLLNLDIQENWNLTEDQKKYLGIP